MQLKKFSVTNYKVFKKRFSIEFANESIVILTGRNNTGKSTVLEAINCFFAKESKAKTIPSECFSDRNKPIILEAVFQSDGDEEIKFIKEYKAEQAPKFKDSDKKDIKKGHEHEEILEEILNNKPFYITPSMLPEDINSLIQEIYSEIIKNDLHKLEKMESPESEEEKTMWELAKEYKAIRESHPEFLRKIKMNTDGQLKRVSEEVSKNLRNLFSNQSLSLNVVGGESEGFTASDILKSTNSSVNIVNENQTSEHMPLQNQGTGLQRMSLIYLIQNMIQNKFMGEDDNKLLLIDEPEAFLHPEAIRALSRSLYSIGKDMPLMISTHSPILIDLAEKHTSIQVFRVCDDDKKAIELYKSANDKFNEDDIQNMKILNYADSYVNEFFFADQILIVEGDTEYIAFKHLAKEKDINLHVIRARGKATIQTLMKILNQFNTNYDVLHDVDNHRRYSASTLKAQKTNCNNILALTNDNKVRVFVSKPNFERAIGIDDVENSKKTETIYKIINGTFGLGEEDFENARNYIVNLFDYIVGDNNVTDFDGDFEKVNKKEDYDVLFDDVIATEFKDAIK